MKNLEKFLSLLDGEVDGLLLTSRYSRHYGAEFDIAEGMAIVTKKGCRYFTDSRYIESAQANIKGFEVLDVNSGRNYAQGTENRRQGLQRYPAQNPCRYDRTGGPGGADLRDV